MSEHVKPRGNLLVLAALSDGAKHGYEIAAAVKERTSGLFTLSFGKLYPLLHQLEADALIEGEWQDVGAKQKKVYRLTRAGKKALGQEREQFDASVAAMGKLMGGKA